MGDRARRAGTDAAVKDPAAKGAGSPPRLASGGKCAALVPLLAGAVLLAPNVAVIVTGTEDFPFTVAPMFAHYVGPDTKLYAFRFEGERNGVAEEIRADTTNREESKLVRQFVSFYYRPLTATSPLRDLSGQSDDSGHLATRMVAFLEPIDDFLLRKHDIEYEQISVWVDAVDSEGNLIETHQVGVYDTASHTYEHMLAVTE